ncbi:MAG: hypothetical protein JW797_00565 [Bradymonadales bacterium]|nr:hypothetical protein [Bradymonadales bacterium]
MRTSQKNLLLGYLLLCLTGLTIYVSLSGHTAAAQTLHPPSRYWGLVEDGMTGAAVPGVLIRIGDQITYSDDEGSYWLEVTGEEVILEVFADLPDGSRENLVQTGISISAGESRFHPITLITEAFLTTYPVRQEPIGLPWPHARIEPVQAEPIDLWELWRSRQQADRNPEDPSFKASLPDLLPETIRVARRFASTCTDNPIVRIDEVDLETYAAGVVTAEIGVFRALTTGAESAYECFKVFSIAGLSYALWFWARDPDAEYHLDDTACNQRYIDGPYPEIIVQAVQETVGAVLVQAGTTATIDKYEYASSCGRHGTLPEYQEQIVEDDIPSIVACTTGGWCGHNNCAGHQDNPDLPGTDRCLVRGICQWGSAERSIRGDDYLAILQHYQPNLQIRWFGEEPSTRLLGFVRSGSIETGENLFFARIQLDTGEITYTDSWGLYTFERVEPGLRTIEVTAAGYLPAQVTKEVLAGVDNWASVPLQPVPSDELDLEPDADQADDLSADPSLTDPDRAESDQDGEPVGDLDHREEGDPGGVVGRFGIVGPEGTGGCGCRHLDVRPDQDATAGHLWLLALVLVVYRSKAIRR